MLLADLQRRVIEIVTQRVRGGEFSERGLARKLGVSQSHFHNVLKGVRYPSIDLTDEVMVILGITLNQLLDDTERAALMKECAGGLPMPDSPRNQWRSRPTTSAPLSPLRT